MLSFWLRICRAKGWHSTCQQSEFYVSPFLELGHQLFSNPPHTIRFVWFRNWICPKLSSFYWKLNRFAYFHHDLSTEIQLAMETYSTFLDNIWLIVGYCFWPRSMLELVISMKSSAFCRSWKRSLAVSNISRMSWFSVDDLDPINSRNWLNFFKLKIYPANWERMTFEMIYFLNSLLLTDVQYAISTPQICQSFQFVQ